MSRERPTQPPPLKKGEPTARLDCTLLGVSYYPEDGVDLHPVIAFTCTEIIPDALKKNPLASVSCFLTREPKSTLWPNVDEEKIDGSPGFVAVLHEQHEDTLFYFAAALRADAYVYVFPRSSLREELLFAIWERVNGVGAFVNRNGHALTQLPNSAIMHILPKSIAAGGRDEDVVH